MKADARRYRSDVLLREAMKIAAVALMALSTGGCSFTYGLAGYHEEEPQATGSVAPKTAISPLSPDLNEEDWRRAKAALGVALDPQGAGTQVSWDNPDTSHKGVFAPTSPPFVKNDEICRAFSAQVTGSAPHSLEGSACRPSGGEWEIKDLKPAKVAKS
ncbi:RT0821/Lpp0805 family surface protein [Microvirga rosea]|uniref:RT0821/Lpp0805 family surface protein n=1 Tax=Microvirga rosea TaxID=2715425 RepID=UPI001D09A280|nr:RT0821/Lpp0805 family surface protein [Microvirga rosea]